MNCRLTDNKVVLRNGSAVSVPYNQFENTEQIERYNGAVLKLIQNGEQTWLLWIEYNAKSIEDIQIISSLRQIYHIKKQKNLNYASSPRIKCWCSIWNARLDPKRLIKPGKMHLLYVKNCCQVLFQIRSKFKQIN